MRYQELMLNVMPSREVMWAGELCYRPTYMVAQCYHVTNALACEGASKFVECGGTWTPFEEVPDYGDDTPIIRRRAAVRELEVLKQDLLARLDEIEAAQRRLAF